MIFFFKLIFIFAGDWIFSLPRNIYILFYVIYCNKVIDTYAPHTKQWLLYNLFYMYIRVEYKALSFTLLHYTLMVYVHHLKKIAFVHIHERNINLLNDFDMDILTCIIRAEHFRLYKMYLTFSTMLYMRVCAYRSTCVYDVYVRVGMNTMEVYLNVRACIR